MTSARGLDSLTCIDTYISMTRNKIKHTVSETTLNLLQIPLNAVKNCVNVLLRQNAPMKQHLQTSVISTTIVNNNRQF